jgi:hypothetical protein
MAGSVDRNFRSDVPKPYLAPLTAIKLNPGAPEFHRKAGDPIRGHRKRLGRVLAGH